MRARIREKYPAHTHDASITASTDGGYILLGLVGRSRRGVRHGGRLHGYAPLDPRPNRRYEVLYPGCTLVRSPDRTGSSTQIEGSCEIGVAYFPALDEMVYAATDSGCYLNGRRVRVTDTETLAESYASFTDSKSFGEHGREEAWRRVQDKVLYGPGWSDAYGHALVATGRLELMLDPVMNPWDCAPFPPILREAGGYFGDWSGTETIYGGEALSTTRTLLPQVLHLLQG